MREKLGGFERIEIDMGDQVLCDSCSVDYTNSTVSGGIQFQSKAICPDCVPRWMERIEKYGEQKFIRATCPKDKTFADWVREDLR